MTEAGEKWAIEQAKRGIPRGSGYHGDTLFITQPAEFWLRAFVAEVEKRIAESNISHYPSPHPANCVCARCEAQRGKSLFELTRELLGEKP